MKRIDILQRSLEKKQTKFDTKLAEHFDTVKQSNGQPLNDKRNGRATLNKWEQQDDALRRLNDGIEKTKLAIEREQFAIARAKSVQFPHCIQSLIDAGTLTVWRKFPKFLFVKGVSKARIKYDGGKVIAYHCTKLSEAEYAVFRDVFNSLRNSLTESTVDSPGTESKQ